MTDIIVQALNGYIKNEKKANIGIQSEMYLKEILEGKGLLGKNNHIQTVCELMGISKNSYYRLINTPSQYRCVNIETTLKLIVSLKTSYLESKKLLLILSNFSVDAPTYMATQIDGIIRWLDCESSHYNKEDVHIAVSKYIKQLRQEQKKKSY